MILKTIHKYIPQTLFIYENEILKNVQVIHTRKLEKGNTRMKNRGNKQKTN